MNAKLTSACVACGALVSLRAERCPNCGHPTSLRGADVRSRRRAFALAFTGLAALFTIVWLVGVHEPMTLAAITAWGSLAVAYWIAYRLARRD